MSHTKFVAQEVSPLNPQSYLIVEPDALLRTDIVDLLRGAVPGARVVALNSLSLLADALAADARIDGAVLRGKPGILDASGLGERLRAAGARVVLIDAPADGPLPDGWARIERPFSSQALLPLLGLARS